MEEGGQFSDPELRRALLRHLASEPDVDPTLLDELRRRGFLDDHPGPPGVTPGGRLFVGLDSPIDEDVRKLVIAARTLRYVVAVGQERSTPDGGRLVLTAVEVWTNEVVVHWTAVGTAQRPWDDRADPVGPATLTDNVGTGYPMMSGGGGGGLYIQQMHAQFTGTPPEEASTLTFQPADPEIRPFLVPLP